MDPTANLEEQLRLARALVEADEPDADDTRRLAELVLALNDWLCSGGFSPPSWRKNARS